MPKIKVNTVNHHGVPVKDRNAAFKFYKDLLGLDILPSMVDSPNIVWMGAADGTMVHLIEPNASGKMAEHHYAYEVEDFDAALQVMRDEGYEIDGPGERHDGQRYFFVRDPDGNRVEFVTKSNLKPSNRVADEFGHTREP
ncbi:MAG: VOC family protein [Dehalococcoidia bacterium]